MAGLIYINIKIDYKLQLKGRLSDCIKSKTQLLLTKMCF